ncbi:MAG: ketoacyl-ACP synthase III [Syntrophobacteraceae bacterium]|nr:ketoacyl-ACP synthase III [Syntrophobacteraceae bacterium]
MKNTIISATASYLPENEVLNEQLTQFPADSRPRIAEKTGVLARRIAPEHSCTSDLAIEAGLKCLEKAKFPPEKVQGVVLSTSSPDCVQPPTAARAQAGLGVPQAFAFDINSVCSGSTFGICMADALIRSGRFENILFIAAEMYSKILNPNDFGTTPYFGDGAGAILFEAGVGEKGVLHSCLGTDGHMSEEVGVFGGGTLNPYRRLPNPNSIYLKMNGRAIKEFALKRGCEIIRRLAGETGIDLSDVDCFICHQANVNILKELAAGLNVSFEKFFVNLDRYGNTASASVVIALDEAIEAGMIGEGSLVATVAFGGGLSYGANLIRF